MNPRMMARKEADEKALRDEVARKPGCAEVVRRCLGTDRSAYREPPANGGRIAFSNLAPSRLGQIASRSCVTPKRSKSRTISATMSSAIRNSNHLHSPDVPAPIYPEMEEAVLAAWLEEGLKTLGPNDPFVAPRLAADSGGGCKAAVDATQLGNVAFR